MPMSTICLGSSLKSDAKVFKFNIDSIGFGPIKMQRSEADYAAARAGPAAIYIPQPN